MRRVGAAFDRSERRRLGGFAATIAATNAALHLARWSLIAR
jgi:hypothetical protein